MSDVIQSDRDAAAELEVALGNVGSAFTAHIREGLEDESASVQALAAHRIASTADLRSKLDVAREFCAPLARLTDTECDFIRGVGMHEDGFALRAAARTALALTAAAIRAIAAQGDE